MYGWAGRLLFVDLATGRVHTRETAEWAEKYPGGRALGAALAWELVRAGMQPFDSDAPLMFLNGPLSGTAAPSAGRVTICALAPQTWPVQWFSRASMGGNWGHHLKYAGYDGLVVTGQAPHPVYLQITEERVSLEDARDLWGLGIMRTQELLRARHGKKTQIATIGPAGENRSAIASIGTNEGSAAGQGGLGAVMGAKQLKAVAVFGTLRPELAHPTAFRQLGKAIAQEQLADLQERKRRAGVTQSDQGPYHARLNRCSAGCIIGCGRSYADVPGTVHPERRYSGIQQCTSGRFKGAEDAQWNLGFEAGFELNVTANDWGINHWDLVKGLFPWIGMCQEEGLLEDLADRPIACDSPQFWYDILEAIATQRGAMAAIVGDGGWRAIQRTGVMPEQARQLYTAWGYANHWDGRGPRGNVISYPFWLPSVLLWLIDTRDPMGSAHGYVQNMWAASPFGPVGRSTLTWEQLMGIGERVYGEAKAMDPLSGPEGKASVAWWHARRSMIKDSLPLCDRVFPRLFTAVNESGLPEADGLAGPDFEAQLYALATGHDVDTAELERMAERALTLERLEQHRDLGRTRASEEGVLDYFCDTVEEHANPLLGVRKRGERAELEALLDAFYAMRGWRVTDGLPGDISLKELGLTEQGRQALG